MTKKAEPPPSFEQALERLEAIVESLERGDMALGDSLKLFEEGVALARRLETELSDAEMKVEALLRDADGKETVARLVLPEDEA
ncbi:MAG: exodeoxyribonuclease VII small subunit [Acidobacteriota bacterium]